jgi:hypothetical protein
MADPKTIEKMTEQEAEDYYSKFQDEPEEPEVPDQDDDFHPYEPDDDYYESVYRLKEIRAKHNKPQSNQSVQLPAMKPMVYSSTYSQFKLYAKSGKFNNPAKKQLFADYLKNRPTCPITYEEVQDNDKIIILPCCHLFSQDACVAWIRDHKSCPTCRRTFTGVNIVYSPSPNVLSIETL